VFVGVDCFEVFDDVEDVVMYLCDVYVYLYVVLVGYYFGWVIWVFGEFCVVECCYDSGLVERVGFCDGGFLEFEVVVYVDLLLVIMCLMVMLWWV